MLRRCPVRKLPALLLLVPFGAVLVFGCDEVPTEPETAVAATTVQESSTPQAARVPGLPTPVKLSGLTLVRASVSIAAGGGDNVAASCPEGKYPVTGGVSYPLMELGASFPVNLTNTEWGWWGFCFNRDTVAHDCTVFAVCVDASLGDPPVIYQ